MQKLYFGYVKNFRRHFKARNLNGSVVCTCARASAWIGVSSKFSIFIGSQQYLRAVIKTSANNILPVGATILLKKFRRRKKIYFTVRSLHQRDIHWGKTILTERQNGVQVGRVGLLTIARWKCPVKFVCSKDGFYQQMSLLLKHIFRQNDFTFLDKKYSFS